MIMIMIMMITKMSTKMMMMILLFDQVVTAADCAKQCAEEPQCHGWSHFAPAKRYNDGDDKIMMMLKLG